MCAQNTDLFIGMHGDGWADAMFLRSEAVAFHMVPYGWLRAPGTARPLIRGNFYKTMVVSCAVALLAVYANSSRHWRMRLRIQRPRSMLVLTAPMRGTA